MFSILSFFPVGAACLEIPSYRRELRRFRDSAKVCNVFLLPFCFCFEGHYCPFPPSSSVSLFFSCQECTSCVFIGSLFFC